jgi:hypothetical protein
MITPTVKLFYLEGSNPKDYDLVVSIDERLTSGVKLSEHQGIPEGPYSGYTYEISIGTGTEDNHVSELRVPLGIMELDPEHGEIEVVLKDGSSSIIGKGKVRAEEAQQESRPIEEF